MCGAGALGGIGFTMSLFIAGVAFPDRADYAGRQDRHLDRLTVGRRVGCAGPVAEIRSEQ
ncbi:MAG: Na+/H+ antiporter NhaA [Gemmatimonadota bacterium]